MADKRISQLIERVDIANNDVLPIVASGATTTNKVTISTLQTWMQGNLDVGVTSVGLTMPSAFSVSGSPVTTSGNITVSAAGTASQYIRGDGTLADFPTGGGGGSSVSYYLNGSVSQGTIGGIAYRELNKTPILGAGTDFTIAANGYIASFVTDAGDPGLLEIPAGNWNFETYFSASSSGGTPSFYVELYKISGTTATLIASNSATPELIAFGTTINPYFSALAVPQTSLLVTDRLALRYYVTPSGRTITLHTENSHLCQIITTFTTGLTALNGLTAQVQNFAVGTSGTDFNISSSGSIHTFNLPDASTSNRGAVTTGTQTFAGEKTFSNTITVNTPSNGLSSIYNGRSSDSVNIIRFNNSGASSLQNFIQSTPTDLIIGTQGNTPIYFVTNNGGGGGIRLTISGSGGILAQSSFEANSIRKTGGTSSQFLKADGSVDSSTYLTTSSAAATYVPYTGATGAVNLGTHAFAASQININGASPTGGSYLGFKHSNSVTTGTDGYTSMYTFGTNTISFKSISGATTKDFSFSMVGITAGVPGGRTYNLPDASGTLALTSDLGGYLPLTGGTLTGALNGTSASFSGDVTLQGSVTRNLRFLDSSNTNLNAQIQYDQISSNTGQLLFGTNNAGTFGTRLTISSTGAATFSSSVTATANASGRSGLFGGSSFGLRIDNGGSFNNGGTTLHGVDNTFVASYQKLSLNGSSLEFMTDYSPRVTITNGGNVGIGTASPQSPIDVISPTNGYVSFGRNISVGQWTGIHFGYREDNTAYRKSAIVFERTGGAAEGKIHILNNGSADTSSASLSDARLTITSTGNVGIGTASPAKRLQVEASVAGEVVIIKNTRNNGNGDYALVTDLGSNDNNTNNYHYIAATGNVDRLYIYGNGNVVNTNNSYGSLSDAKVKENIEDATPKLDDLMKVKVRNYNLIGDDKKQIGVIAQELEEVFPAMIDESEDFEEVEVPQVDEEGNEVLNEDGEVVTEKQRVSKGTSTKSVKYSVFVPMLIKAMQEQQEQIKSLTKQVEALKSQING